MSEFVSLWEKVVIFAGEETVKSRPEYDLARQNTFWNEKDSEVMVALGLDEARFGEVDGEASGVYVIQ